MAYYSTADPAIYHLCKNCKVGNNIEAPNLCEGQPSEARLCKICAEMLRKGECTYGTPKPAR